MENRRLQALREQLNQLGVDGFYLPLTDEFMGEYIPDSEKRLGWLTGFTGSAGLAVITKDKAAFFTDGRYTLQAKEEVSSGFEILNMADVSPVKWVSKNCSSGTLGYDPKLVTIQTKKQLQNGLPNAVALAALQQNPVDVIWEDRPKAPASPIVHQPMECAGWSVEEKYVRIASQVKQEGADALLITASDSLCWLLNMRANDIPHTPFARCYGLLLAEGGIQLFVDHKRIESAAIAHWGKWVTVLAVDSLQNTLQELGSKGFTISLDPSQVSGWLEDCCNAAKLKILNKPDPCQLIKAIKNPVEIEGTKRAHRIDGLALTKFLAYLQEHATGMDELAVCEVLEQFRKESKDYIEPSFPTISGSGPNGAIVHYRVSEKTNRRLDQNNLLLVDSGGQYRFGTTDVTRTVAIGTPSQEMKENFTRVLKGHIALATAIFPEGTNGMQLDALARQYLWQAGLDYDHGTGHGVGSYLSVHEGPQRISKRGSDIALQAGMILSNEPGYYKNGEYGIRIENLIVVVEKFIRDGKRYFGFETLTLAPIDSCVIAPELLTDTEKLWLLYYHARVLETHQGFLNTKEKQWLEKVIAL
jgi:Xaa-Pro aminopeptidase